MHQPFFTIDTDNAIIRFYHNRVIAEGGNLAISRIILASARNVATALSREFKTTFHVEVVL